MKLHLPAIQIPAAAFAALTCLSTSQAAFLTGFETSSGYGTNTTVIGVHDTAAPGTNSWTKLFTGADSIITSSTAHPQTGSQALTFDKTDTTNAVGATLTLGSSVDLTQPFTMAFALSVNSVSAGTGGQAQILLGAGNTNAGSSAFWTRVVYDNGTIKVLVNNADGTGVTDVSVGSYTTYSNLGDYIDFSISIDPTTMKYTNIQITGSLSSANVTSTVLASASGGVVPHLNVAAASIGTNVTFASGGNDQINMNIDNLSVVPEPGSALLLGAGLSFLLLRVRRREF
jgi:hypothetical protein